MAKVTNKVAKTLGEYESIIDVYERNGFKVKSKTDKETILFKKTRTKKWRTFKPSSLALFKFVIVCCTAFTIIFIYNALHTKKEKVIVTLAE